MLIWGNAATDADMLESVEAYRLVGFAAAALIALLTIPAIGHLWNFRKGYSPINNDGFSYQDRDGIAKEDSIKAFSDTRPRVVVGLAVAAGTAALVASRLPVLGVAYDPVAWAELAFWVTNSYYHQNAQPLTNKTV